MDEEFAAFEACYRGAFGDRLHVVRGNHDAYRGQARTPATRSSTCPASASALLDTVIPTMTTGRVTTEQLDWLDDLAAEVGPARHRHGAPPELGRAGTTDARPADYFGINPDDSDALVDVVARRPRIVAYAAGHTHRNRVRRLAEHRRRAVHRGGLRQGLPRLVGRVPRLRGRHHQIHHRISTPEALAWSERCRHLYQDFGVDYETYALGRLEDRCFTISIR